MFISWTNKGLKNICIKSPDYLLERISAETHNISLSKDEDHGVSDGKTIPGCCAGGQFSFEGSGLLEFDATSRSTSSF